MVTITRENRDRVSFEHKGMIQNLDGTFSRTPQYETWRINQDIQLEKVRDVNPRKPEEVGEDHPDTSDLEIKWTHEGEWVLVPTFGER